MKYSAWFLGVFGVFLASIYIVLFTIKGNSIIQPIIEKKLQEQTKLASKLSKFSVTMSNFSIILELDNKNTILVNGNYSIFSQAFNIAYKVRINSLESLNSLTNAPLRGKLYTEGIVKGDMEFIEIDGLSDVANSNTLYHIELTDFNPTSIIAKIKKAKLDSILYLSGQDSYADATIDLDINFKNINPHQLDGNIVLTTLNGKLDEQLLKKDFNITLPTTLFDMNLDATLAGDNVNYSYKLISNLVKITSVGNVFPDPLAANIKYSVDIKELALLKPITGADIRGVFKLDGDIIGDKNNMIVNGKSDVASSDTKFEIILKEFKPSRVKANMKNLDLSKVFYMVKQPHYTDGLFSLDLNISDARVGHLKGTVNTNIKNGLIDSAYMTKAYAFNSQMPLTTFTLETNSFLSGSIVDTKIKLYSSLAKFEIQKASYDIFDGSLNSDYVAKIIDLEQLFFVTDRHLKGDISIDGEFKKAKDLDLTINSIIAGGTIDMKLHNDDFNAKLNGVQTLDILSILTYPKVFQSTLNAQVDYNLVTQKGDFNGNFKEGTFTKNEMFNLVKKYAKIDLYKENFNGDISAKIDKENILASLDLKSRTASIKTVDTKIDSLKQTIDSEVTVTTTKYPVILTLNGEITNPEVGIDYKELMKSEVGKKIKEEILDTKVGKQVQKQVIKVKKELLNSEVGKKVHKELDGFLNKFF